MAAVSFTDAPTSANASCDWSNEVLAPLRPDEQSAEFTSKRRVQYYSDNAQSYGSDMVKYSFTGPMMTAKVAHSVLYDNQNAFILDVGCGTGMVVEEMNKLGSYKNVDGLEPATGMLQLARDKCLYKNYMERFFFLNSGIPHNTYDAVVTCGTFLSGHLKVDCLVEIYNILKPGGYGIIVMRKEHLETVEEYKLYFRATIEQLVEEGKWECVRDEAYPNWCYARDGHQGIDGQIFVLKKLE